MSYLHALVYHDRERPEHRGLQERIEQVIRAADHQTEVRAMRQTIADGFREEGEKRGVLRQSRRILLLQLRLRFGDLPRAVVDAVEGCADVAKLDAWMGCIAMALRLSDMGIAPPS